MATATAPIKVARGVLTHAGKVFLIWQDEFEQWVFPGGKTERDETPHDALIRELQEETGVVVRKATLIEAEPPKIYPTGVFQLYLFAVDTFVGWPTNRVPDKHSKAGWFSVPMIRHQPVHEVDDSVHEWLDRKSTSRY